jgi:hypothetical protein
MEKALSGGQVIKILFFIVCFAFGYMLPEILAAIYERIKYGKD